MGPEAGIHPSSPLTRGQAATRPGHEQDQERLDHKAAQLHRLGWQTGAGSAIWARVVTDELERHESARASFVANPNRDAWDRVHGTAYVLVVAIDQVLAFEQRLRKLTGDAELKQARDRFDVEAPQARALRDLVAHLDAYAVSEGHRQTGDQHGPRITDPYVERRIHWTEGGDTALDLGNDRLYLRSAAEAAVNLADTVERVRERHLERTEREANAALRRRHGLDR